MSWPIPAMARIDATLDRFPFRRPRLDDWRLAVDQADARGEAFLLARLAKHHHAGPGSISMNMPPNDSSIRLLMPAGSS